MKSIKRICYLALVISFLFTPMVTHAAESNVDFSKDSEIQVLMDGIDWRYKVEDGKLYRRLYNYSTKQWIGEWELCS